MSASNDLTFIRCPSCRSLVPAVSSRCRMCGNSLRSDAQPESVEERKTARVRQPTASLTSAEADRLRGDSETFIDYSMTDSGEALIEEEGEAEEGGLVASGIEDGLGESEVTAFGTGISSSDVQVAFDVETPEAGFKEEASDIEGMTEIKGGEESELWSHDYGALNESDSTEVELLTEVSVEDGLDSPDWGEDRQAPLDLGDDAAPSIVGVEDDSLSDRGSSQLSLIPLEEAGGDVVVDALGTSEANELMSGWHDGAETKIVDEEETPDISSLAAGAVFVEDIEVDNPTEQGTGEPPEPSPVSVREAPRPASRPLHFGRRQTAPGAEQSQPRAQTGENEDIRAAQRAGKPYESSPRWGGEMKGGAGTEALSKPGRTERSVPIRPHQEPSRDAVGRGRVSTNARTAAANLADVPASRLFGWLVSYKNSSGAAIELREGKTLLTGSSLKKGDLVIDAPSISTPHAMFTMRSDSGLFVQDLMSERGVWVRRKQEDTYQREEDGIELKHGDWVRFGDEEFLVSLVPYVGVQ